MSVRRDPDTGRFVSVDGSRSGVGYTDTDVFVGQLASKIPAADLGGGTTQVAVENDKAKLIGFGGALDSDEWFEVLRVRTRSILGLANTATAESWAAAMWELSQTAACPTISDNAVFDPAFVTAPHDEEGVIDIATWDDSHHSNRTLARELLVGTNQLADSAAGLAGGGDFDRQEQVVDYTWMEEGPTFDHNDALYIPHEFAVDNAADHGVQLDVQVVLEGLIHGDD